MAELATMDANDRIFNVLWGAGALDGAFLCECTREGCIEKSRCRSPSMYA